MKFCEVLVGLMRFWFERGGVWGVGRGCERDGSMV